MNYEDYVKLNCIQKLAYNIKCFMIGIPANIVKFFCALWKYIKSVFAGIALQLKELALIFKNGDMKTRLSFFIMGLGCVLRGQVIKGLLYFIIEVSFIFYMVSFGWIYLKDIGTLGTNVKQQVWDEQLQIYRYVQGDNSMLILLFSVLTIILIFVFTCVYIMSIKRSYENQRIIEDGGVPATFRQDIHSLADERFHVTLLAAPTILVSAFTILPLIFMILIAFTNFDKTHQPPGNLFSWVGLSNFKSMLLNGSVESYTFGKLLGWTLIWAVLATFTNYIVGIILAMMINKKGIRFKKFWRTMFVVSIAVPQFVTLLLMSQLLHEQGAINVLLKQLGIAKVSVPFLTNANLARICVVVVNMWIGVPYTILITTGILMNIPEDMYEAARIDGASTFQTFVKITMPYMLFVTTPYLITQFIGNINNFNVIYLLTAGGPLSLQYYQAGKTDLLVTWLYKLTVNEQNYSFASTIGILVFILSAVFALISYNTSASAKKEEEFQ